MSASKAAVKDQLSKLAAFGIEVGGPKAAPSETEAVQAYMSSLGSQVPCARCIEQFRHMEAELETSRGALHALMQKQMEAVCAKGEAEAALEVMRDENKALKSMVKQLTAQLQATATGSRPPDRTDTPSRRVASGLQSITNAVGTQAVNAMNALISPRAADARSRPSKPPLSEPAIHQRKAPNVIEDFPPSMIPALNETHDGSVMLNYDGFPEYIKDVDTEWHSEMLKQPSLKGIRSHVAHICRSEEHPVGFAIAGFVGQFNKSAQVATFEVAATRVRKYVTILHKQVCAAFGAILLTERFHTAALAPLEAAVLSPRIANRLTGMCKADCLQEDLQYLQILKVWQQACAHELGVSQRFTKGLATERRGLGSKGEGERCGIFLSCVQRLRGLQHVHSPFDKVGVIRDTCKLIVSCAQEAHPGVQMGADDVLPLLVFCLMQAEVPDLPSELHYIEGMLMEELADDEMGYFLACGKAALGRVLNLECRLECENVGANA